MLWRTLRYFAWQSELALSWVPTIPRGYPLARFARRSVQNVVRVPGVLCTSTYFVRDTVGADSDLACLQVTRNNLKAPL